MHPSYRCRMLYPQFGGGEEGSLSPLEKAVGALREPRLPAQKRLMLAPEQMTVFRPPCFPRTKAQNALLGTELTITGCKLGGSTFGVYQVELEYTAMKVIKFIFFTWFLYCLRHLRNTVAKRKFSRMHVNL